MNTLTPTPNWYVAIVTSRHEKKIAEQLQQQGIESYVATQPETKIWRNGRRKTTDRVVIPSVVFIHCNEKERRQIVTLPYINRFMVNRTVDSGTLNHPVAIIPDIQMRRLMFMLGQDQYQVDFIPTPFRVHDNVRVIRGQLQGLEGTILTTSDGTRRLAISLDLLGGVTVTIDPTDLQKI